MYEKIRKNKQLFRQIEWETPSIEEQIAQRQKVFIFQEHTLKYLSYNTIFPLISNLENHEYFCIIFTNLQSPYFYLTMQLASNIPSIIYTIVCVQNTTENNAAKALRQSPYRQ